MKTPLIVALALATQVAFADEAATRKTAIKQLLDTQASALTHDERESLRGTLASDALEYQQTDLMDPAKIAIGKLSVGWLGTCGWVAAEVQERSRTHPEAMTHGGSGIEAARTWHWLELVVAARTDYRAKAIARLVTMPDNKLAEGQFNYVKELTPETSPTPLVSWLAQPAEMAKHLAKDPAVTVFGTAPRDRAYGPAAAKKLLASWAKLKLDLVADDKKANQSEEVTAGDCAAAAAMVRMKMKDGSILLHAFAIAHKVGDQWELVGVAYSPDRAY